MTEAGKRLIEAARQARANLNRPMFECPDCGGDLADKGHLPTCIQKDKEPDFNSRPNT